MAGGQQRRGCPRTRSPLDQAGLLSSICIENPDFEMQKKCPVAMADTAAGSL